MLDKNTIKLINRLLEQGLDVEIQMRKDTIVILSEKKQVAFSYPVKKR
jgi:hypothetical protein